MSRTVLICIVFFSLPALSFAQSNACNNVAGVKRIARDVHNNPVALSRHGNSIWNNMSIWGWWSYPDTGYLNLDWGSLPDQGNRLPDEVVDGFTFTYGTNNMDPAGETISVYFYDSCTGYGIKGIPEAGFTFSGLPNAATHGSLPPGLGWTLAVTVDLEGTGYEFLLGKEIGIGYVRENTPMMGGTGICLGSPSNKGGNGFTGTSSLFDTYYPNGVYENTWLGSYHWPASPWSTFPTELFGGQDPGGFMTYGGIGAQGNDASLYSIGDWAAGSKAQFLLRKDQTPLPGWLFASTGYSPRYLPNFDITLYPKMPFLAQSLMTPDAFGDFDRCTVDVGPVPAGLRLYFQGAITAMKPLAPVDLSNGVYSN